MKWFHRQTALLYGLQKFEKRLPSTHGTITAAQIQHCQQDSLLAWRCWRTNTHVRGTMMMDEGGHLTSHVTC